MRTRLLPFRVLCIALLLGACSDGPHSLESGGGRDDGTSSFRLDAASIAVAVGDTVRLTPIARDGTGAPAKSEVRWRIDDEGVAIVDNGLLVAIAPGTTRVHAQVGTSTATATLTSTGKRVEQASLTIEPKPITVRPGEVVPVNVILTFSNSMGVRLRSSVDWQSLDPSVAVVESGSIRGVTLGEARIIASVAGISDTAVVAVKPAVSLSVAPSTVSLPAGETATLRVSLSDGRSIETLGALTWVSSAPSVATVSAAGVVTAVKEGAAAVSVSGGGLSASASVTVVLPRAPAVFHIPEDIAADCSQDVTSALHAWIASVPDSSVLVFGEEACYNIDGGLVITDRHGLTFEGRGATFRVFSRGHRDRANWRLRSGSDLTLRNMIARGANPNAGLAEAAYDTNVEGQHAYRIEGTQGVLLDSVQAYDVWGDFVEAEPDWRAAFPGQPTRDVVVRGSRFERNGRMGVGLTHVDGFVLQDSYMGDVRWSAIDVELDDNRELGRNIRIERNRFGRIAHHLFVTAGAGRNDAVGNISIRGNVMEEDALTCLAPVLIRTPEWRNADGSSIYWSGWLIEDNVFHPQTGGWAIDLTRAKDVVIRNNSITSRTHSGCGSSFTMHLQDSHGVAVVGNSLVTAYTAVGRWWTTTLSADSLSSSITLLGNVLR